MLDLLVIGGGPAGVTGAVQAHRSGLKTLLLEKEWIGGLIRTANLVENYPGMPRPMDGHTVAGLLESHLERSGVPYRIAAVIALRQEGGLFHAETCSEGISARSVLLATGSRPKPLALEDTAEAERIGLMYYEVHRLPQLTAADRILIVGGGDAAFDYALNVARQGARATILVRGPEPQCLPLLHERVADSPAVDLITKTQVLKVACDGPDHVRLTCRQDEAADDLTFTGEYLLAAVGREPDSRLAETLDPLRPGCYDSGSGKDGRSRPLLYLAGDAAHGRFRQMSIAAGDGMLAAMEAAAALKG